MDMAAEARIFLLTGPVHAGKTSFLRDFLQDACARGLNCNGILSLAAFQGPDRIGYDACDLRSGDRYPLLRVNPEPGWFWVGPFGMIPEGLRRAEAAILDSGRSDLTVIDEMGPLELAKAGFWPVFQKVVRRRQPVLAVVRSDLASRFQEAVDGDARVFRLQDASLSRDLRRELDLA